MGDGFYLLNGYDQHLLIPAKLIFSWSERFCNEAKKSRQHVSLCSMNNLCFGQKFFMSCFLLTSAHHTSLHRIMSCTNGDSIFYKFRYTHVHFFGKVYHNSKCYHALKSAYCLSNDN